MRRIAMSERANWKETAARLGFEFHTIDGERYWDERGCYTFSIQQVEEDIESPTEEIHEMAMSVVGEVVESEELLTKLMVPSAMWDLVRLSWTRGDMHLYGRMDFAYDGKSPARLYELNYDTPTSLYEASFFQWVWLEEQIASGNLPASSDQFNSLQEKLVTAFGEMGIAYKKSLHLASVSGSVEDRGTVDYLRDCAHQAGLRTKVMDVEDIGWNGQAFVDTDNAEIEMLFKLYPLEQMFEDDFAKHLLVADMQLIEPAWKSVLSNKGLMALLWDRHPGHPNLLAAHFEGSDTQGQAVPTGWVRKPLFSREGANIELGLLTGERVVTNGPYGGGANILQACRPLTRFTDANGVGGFPIIGSWVVGDSAAGMGVREDDTLVTKDTARFVPHAIVE